MTIDDFWKKYNHCPLCENYVYQGALCDGCKWMFPVRSEERPFDKFVPTGEAKRMMNREVTGW